MRTLLFAVLLLSGCSRAAPVKNDREAFVHTFVRPDGEWLPVVESSAEPVVQFWNENASTERIHGTYLVLHGDRTLTRVSPRQLKHLLDR